MESVKVLSLDFRGLSSIMQTIRAVQYDEGRAVRVMLSGTEGKINGSKIYCQKPSGMETYTAGTVINDYCVMFALTPQMLAETGIVKAQMQLIDGERVVTSFDFQIQVSKNRIAESSITSSNEYQALTEAIKVVDQAEAKIEQNKADIAALKIQAEEGISQNGSEISDTKERVTNVEQRITDAEEDITDLIGRDYVLEEDFSNTASMYRKWNSGLLEVWTSSLYSMPVNNAWGGCYRSENAVGKMYPVSFKEVPQVLATVKTDVNDACWLVQRQGERTNQAPDYYFVRPDSIGFSAKFYVSTYSIGRWK